MREGYRLGDNCLKIGSGATPRGGKETYLEEGPVALIRSQNIHNDRFSYSGLAYISEHQAAQLRNVVVEEGDVLLNITGDSVARVCQVDSRVLPARVNQHVAIIRPDPDVIDPHYLRYYLVTPSFQAHMLALAASGATRNALTKGMIEEFRVPRTPIYEQRAVASILGALDDKIDLNRRMNETLEAMARALFKDWFVDFGPTRAKMEGREPYLAPELWALFPDRLDDEGKPAGWTSEPIGEHLRAQKGLSYKGSGLTDANRGIPLHNLNSVIEGGGYKASGLKYYSGEYQSRHRIKPGDLIVANTEQGFDHLLIGYSAIVPRWAGAKGLFSHHLFKIEPREGSPLSRVWLHYAISSSPAGDAIRRFSNGTTVNMLPSDAFLAPSLVVPPHAIVSSFAEAASLFLDRKELNFDESQTLAQTRDLLLPKLMSGEIRVREAKRIVEKVV